VVEIERTEDVLDVALASTGRSATEIGVSPSGDEPTRTSTGRGAGSVTESAVARSRYRGRPRVSLRDAPR
jgi:hypothetical protein